MKIKLNNKQVQVQYKLNLSAKVGDEIICPICGHHFIKKSYQQKFDSIACKDKYHNFIHGSDRHYSNNYHHNYNLRHPERLERIGIYKDRDGRFGYYDENDDFRAFEDDAVDSAMCENPILGM